jgi:pimeloyl-ACP methyl ester carboxylesterase
MLAGTRDALVGVDRMRAMARMLGSQCEMVVVPDGEHILTYANPDPVNRAISHFYQRVPSPRGPRDGIG